MKPLRSNQQTKIESKTEGLFDEAMQRTLETNLESNAVDSEGNEELDSLDDDIFDEDIEIVDEDVEEVNSNNNIPSKSDVALDKISEAITSLAEMQKPAEVKPTIKERAKPQQVDVKKLREEFNNKLHDTDDPFAVMTEFANQMVGPQLAQQNMQLQKVNKNMLIQDVSHPEFKYAFENYNVEIENAIADLPASQQGHPDAYEFAAKQVILNHFSEISKGMADNEESPSKTTVRPGKTRMVSGDSNPTVPITSVKKKIKLTSLQEKRAARLGMSKRDYALYLQEKKKRGN